MRQLVFQLRLVKLSGRYSAGIRITVGQAFQPDSSGCQAGKPDLLEDPVF
jgi:hypothetical protein